MDNVKINISDEKIYIKKGFFRIKFLVIYYFFVLLLFIFLALGELSSINFFNKIISIISNSLFLSFLIKLNYVILFLSFFLHGTTIGLAFYLEMIVCTDKLKILTPNYEIVLTHNNFEEIFITPHYVYKNFRGEGGTFREYFESKCTVIFRTKDDKEYKWGYTLSYQKGMEIKELIEKKMKEDMKTLEL